MPKFRMRIHPGARDYTGEFWRPYALSRRSHGSPDNPLKMRGYFDPATRTLSLRADRNFQLRSGLKASRFTFTLKSQDNYLVGSVDVAGCSRVAVVPGLTEDPALAAMQILGDLKGTEERTAAEAEHRRERQARKASGWVPVELSPSGGNPEVRWEASTPVFAFEYFDATMDPQYENDGAVRPIDEVFQNLRARDERCLSTSPVTWDGTTGTTTSALFGRKSYVVECQGDCSGLLYTAVVPQWNAMNQNPHHAGKSAKYPILTFSVTFLTRTEVRWTFNLPADRATPPYVRVHMWTQGRTDYGGGCRID